MSTFVGKVEGEGRRLGAVAANDSQWVQVHAASLVAATVLQRNPADQVRDMRRGRSKTSKH